MRVLIVDDEAPARRRLRRMLDKEAELEIVGEAADGVEALEQIAATKPELVFLDIQMPAFDGLALARSVELPPFVFVTAHDEHALAAFEVGAVDYLLKPPSQARLREALARARRRVELRAEGSAREQAAELAELRAALARLVAPPAPSPALRGGSRVSAREGRTVRIFEAREIGRFWSADKYTLFRAEGQERVLDESLSELELRLAAEGFVRVHRAELINLGWVRALHADAGGAVVDLRDGQQARVSRRMLPELKRRLGVTS